MCRTNEQQHHQQQGEGEGQQQQQQQQNENQIEKYYYLQSQRDITIHVVSADMAITSDMLQKLPYMSKNDSPIAVPAGSIVIDSICNWMKNYADEEYVEDFIIELGTMSDVFAEVLNISEYMLCEELSHLLLGSFGVDGGSLDIFASCFNVVPQLGNLLYERLGLENGEAANAFFGPDLDRIESF